MLTEDDLKRIKADLDEMVVVQNGPKAFANKTIFMGILSRTFRVLSYSYMEDFSKMKTQEITNVHRTSLPGIGFNSLGDDYKDKRGLIAQPNIFTKFAITKKNMESTRQIAKERIRQGTVFVNDKGGASANPLGIIPQNRLRKSDSDAMQIKNGLSSPGIKIEPGTSY